MRIPTMIEAREAEVQRATIAFYRSLGCEVVRFSEGRRTNVTPGWPDLGVFHLGRKLFWVHEVKASRGKQSPHQTVVQSWCTECGVPYLLGGVQAASDFLTGIGVLP